MNGAFSLISFCSFGFKTIHSFEKIDRDLFRNLKQQSHECITPSNLNTFFNSVLSNNFPNVYPCCDMGKDSSALSLSFLDLSDFPRYVVLKSEFSSDLVVLTISDWIPLYTSKYASFNIFGVGPKSTSIISFFLFYI